MWYGLVVVEVGIGVGWCEWRIGGWWMVGGGW